nr:CvpA family protein [uncultured Carboxylicivirga sp.]
MNYFDIVIGLILAFALFKGFKNGLIIELASLAALVLGLLGAIEFSSFTADYLSQHINSNHLGLISFIVTFILIVIGVHLIAKVVDKLVSAIALGPVNRILGAIFSLLKYAFILSVLIAVINGFDKDSKLLSQEMKAESYLYKPVASIAPMVFPYLNFDTVKEKFEDVKEGVDV